MIQPTSLPLWGALVSQVKKSSSLLRHTRMSKGFSLMYWQKRQKCSRTPRQKRFNRSALYYILEWSNHICFN